MVSFDLRSSGDLAPVAVFRLVAGETRHGSVTCWPVEKARPATVHRRDGVGAVAGVGGSVVEGG